MINKIILFAGLLAGSLQPVYTGDLTPNLLNNVGTIYFSYSNDLQQYRTSNVYSVVDTQLMTFDYSQHAIAKTISISTLSSFDDYVEIFAVNIVINDYYKFVLMNYIEPDLFDYTGYYNALTLYSPSDFGDEFIADLDSYPDENGGFVVYFYDSDDYISNIKISIDVLVAGSIVVYDDGYKSGFDTGYKSGFDDGYNDAISFYKTNWLGWIGDTLSGIMDIELFMGFTLGGIFGICIIIAVSIWFLKMFAGG